MENVAILATLKAKPGKEAEVESFLKSALPLAQAEPQTISWYAIKIDASTFGVFDTFADDSGRDAHLNGKIAGALMEHAADLLSEPPDIRKVDILAAK